MGMKPPQYLRQGDVMTLGITGLGEQRQEVVPFAKPAGRAVAAKAVRTSRSASAPAKG